MVCSVSKASTESRAKLSEGRRIDVLNEQFEDLKAAIISSIGGQNEREVARGVIRYRRLVDFLRSLRLPDYQPVLRGSMKWDDLLQMLEIKEIFEIPPHISRPDRGLGPMRSRLLLIKQDDSFYDLRYPRDYLNDMTLEFESFTALPTETREVIFDALQDSRMGMKAIRYVRNDYRSYLDELFARSEKFLKWKRMMANKSLERDAASRRPSA